MEKVYTHTINQEVLSIAGSYMLEKEERLKYSGREILYLVGQAVVDSSCCGFGGCRYAVVPGFILSWRSGRSAEGLPTSLVEPIGDQGIKDEVAKLIEQKEKVSQVQFW